MHEFNRDMDCEKSKCEENQNSAFLESTVIQDEARPIGTPNTYSSYMCNCTINLQRLLNWKDGYNLIKSIEREEGQDPKRLEFLMACRDVRKHSETLRRGLSSIYKKIMTLNIKEEIKQEIKIKMSENIVDLNILDKAEYEIQLQIWTGYSRHFMPLICQQHLGSSEVSSEELSPTSLQLSEARLETGSKNKLLPKAEFSRLNKDNLEILENFMPLSTRAPDLNRTMDPEMSNDEINVEEERLRLKNRIFNKLKVIEANENSWEGAYSFSTPKAYSHDYTERIQENSRQVMGHYMQAITKDSEETLTSQDEQFLGNESEDSTDDDVK